MDEPFDRLHDEPEPASSDVRTPTQRDRDRVLYSDSFRRLAGVTQVVPPDGTNFFHNRLTHTLEVAQIGRRIAERLAHESDGALPIDPDAVETASLAHDLGHPPFGHIGETLLDELSRRVAEEEGVDFDGFEGNAQSFRVVAKLTASRLEHPGLNLCRRTLNGILKYPWLKGDVPSRQKKYGAFRSEENDFNFARKYRPASEEQSIEAQIMDYADEVAYGIHDVDDFYCAGLLPLDRLYHDAEAYEYFVEGWLEFERNQAEKLDPSDEGARLPGYIKEASEDELFDELLFMLTSDSEGYAGTRRQRAERKRASSQLIGTFVSDVAVEASGKELHLQVPKARKLELRFLKRLVLVYLINNPSLATQQFGQKEILRRLLESFLHAVRQRDEVLTPARYREELRFLSEHTDDPAKLSAGDVRLAVDIVASLSDVQAVRMYKRLVGIEPGSISDVLEV